MSNSLDITNEVEIQSIEDELLALNKCICGKKFDYWEFTISIYEDDCSTCPSCGRKMYFKNMIKVYEIK